MGIFASRIVMEILRAIRYFEFHVFQGVPEKPEDSFERDNYSSHNERYTGRSLKSSTSIDIDKNDILGYFVDDFENKMQSYEKKSSK